MAARQRDGAMPWLVAGVAVIALAAYVFWPAGGPPPDLRLYSGATPEAFRLRIDGREQTVAAGRVAIAGLDRPADPDKASALFAAFGQVAAAPALVQTASRAQLSAFGIDPARQAVEAQGVLIAWGQTGGDRFIADVTAGKVWPLPSAQEAAIAKAAGRLDREDLVAEAEAATRLEIRTVGGDGIPDIASLTLERQGQVWTAPGQAGRPPFSTRAAILLGLVAALRLERLEAPAVAVGDRAVLRLAWPDGRSVSVRLTTDGQVVADGLPAQALPAALRPVWIETLADLANDRLFDLPLSTIEALAGVEVRRDGKLLFRLERRPLAEQQVEGRSPWAFIWDGGREDARGDAGETILRAFDRVLIRDPARLDGARAAAPGATEIRLIRKDDQTIIARLVVDGDRLTGDAWQGRSVALPDLLARPEAGNFLDPRLTSLPPQRAVKLQRIVRDDGPARGEVFVGDGARWERTWPQPAGADSAAVRRLLHALCGAVGLECRLATAADLALRAAPAIELDVRFAPKPIAKGANNFTDAEDTVPTDLGLCLAPDPVRAGAWRAVERDGGRSWLLPAEVVDALREPVVDRVLLPVPVAMVRSVRIDRPGSSFSVRREGERWMLRRLKAGDDGSAVADGDDVAIDPVAVRRWLRQVAGVRFATQDAGAVAVSAGELAARVTVTVPGTGTMNEDIVLLIGRPSAGTAPVSLSSHLANAQLPPGRLQLSPADAEVLAPGLDAFPIAVP